MDGTSALSDQPPGKREPRCSAADGNAQDLRGDEEQAAPNRCGMQAAARPGLQRRPARIRLRLPRDRLSLWQWCGNESSTPEAIRLRLVDGER